jgi:peptidoglycan/xylan/chitin deacetylase (PgdA/CDA1 family)
MPGIGINIGIQRCHGQSWSSYWATLTPKPLLAYGISETQIDLSVTDVFSGKAKLAWYGSNDGITYLLLTTTAKSILVYSETGLTANTFRYYKVRAEQGSNHSLWSNVAFAATWTTEYNTLSLALTGTKPSVALASKQNLFFNRLKGNNSYSRDTYSKFICAIWYNSGMPTDSDTLFWINNVARKATLSASPPTYVLGKGWTGIAANHTYIDTTFNPSTDGSTKFTGNDASFGLFFGNSRYATYTWGDGGFDLGGNYLAPRISNAPAKMYTAINNVTGKVTSLGIDTIKGFTIVSRVASNLYNIYKDKDLLNTATEVSSALKNITNYDLADKKVASVVEWGGDTVGFRFFASSFDQTDVDVICDAMDEFLDDGLTETWQGSGVCLTFDDYIHIDNWVIYDAVLKETYNWKASFSIGPATQADLTAAKRQLKSLMLNGHEICNHTVNHIDWQTYLLTHTVTEFYNAEIDPLQTSFQNVFGWKPKTFCYAQLPDHDASLDSYVLSHGGFTKVRPGLTAAEENDWENNALVYQNNSNRVIWEMNLNHFSGVVADILAAIDYAQSQNAILVIYNHAIATSDDIDKTNITTLNAICARVISNGMKFYRLKDIPVT